MEGQSFTGTELPLLAVALAAWSAKALPLETGSFDLVCASHLTTAIDEGKRHASNSSPINLPCLMGVPEDVMNPQFAHSVPKSCTQPKAYLESV